PILNDEHPEKVRLDVRRINLMQLEQMGLDAQQIAIAPHCTYQDPDNFFSYRRTHEKKVQWAGIVSH
ncbi:MAG: laccase domain-containing protein, partial [Cyanobacteria bacterium J06555_13]